MNKKTHFQLFQYTQVYTHLLNQIEAKSSMFSSPFNRNWRLSFNYFIHYGFYEIINLRLRLFCMIVKRKKNVFNWNNVDITSHGLALLDMALAFELFHRFILFIILLFIVNIFLVCESADQLCQMCWKQMMIRCSILSKRILNIGKTRQIMTFVKPNPTVMNIAIFWHNDFRLKNVADNFTSRMVYRTMEFGRIFYCI